MRLANIHAGIIHGQRHPDFRERNRGNICGEHADYRDVLAVERYFAADDCGIAAEFAPPYSVAEDYNFRLDLFFVVGYKTSADQWRNAERFKKIPRDDLAANLFGLRAAGDVRDAVEIADCGELLKSFCVGAVVGKIRRRNGGFVAQREFSVRMD